MVNIREVLDSIYPNKKADELIHFLDKGYLYEPFKMAEIQLNGLIVQQAEIRKGMICLPIGIVATNLLISVNSRLQKISESERKDYEAVLSDLSREVLKLFLEKVSEKGNELKYQLSFALEKTCEFQRYDKNQLLEYLNINSIISYNSSLRQGEKISSVSGKIPTLRWLGDVKKFSELQQIFVDQRLLAKRSGFNRLFNSPENILDIQFNEVKADIILQLFSYLKSEKLITYSNCKSIYDVLTCHVLYFREKILKNKTPKVRMNILKNSKTKWAHNQMLIRNWMRGIE